MLASSTQRSAWRSPSPSEPPSHRTVQGSILASRMCGSPGVTPGCRRRT
eukprot:CAMPEP_0171726572 /NCGR_PEP_ID=MMETSP0991-20121206/25750_1 /TAXON_ID=483369 /ORGANISM="non described non described, Strain CCMP2098" /LENGTH=48 /DNA_ID= /DNA_START= /DNA_END= /DNA_ORIENTATION=